MPELGKRSVSAIRSLTTSENWEKFKELVIMYTLKKVIKLLVFVLKSIEKHIEYSSISNNGMNKAI